MRWGIAGFGWVARDYMAPAIRSMGGTIAGIVDPSDGARGAAGEVPLFGSVAELADAGGADALYVATPNHRHRQPVEEALRRGLPVLCEKPIAAALADAEAMIETAGMCQTLLGIAFDQRHHPAHAAIRDAIADGAVGTPTAIRIVYCCWVGPDWCAANWRADADAAGGGAGIDLALHGLDLVNYLLGEDIATLDIAIQRRIHDYGVEDGAMLVARTGSGVLASLHVAYNCPEALPRRRLEIVGTTGAIEAIDTMGQTPGGRVTRQCGRTGAIEALPFAADISPFARQAAAFTRAVGGQPHGFDAARDLALMRRFDAAYRRALACR